MNFWRGFLTAIVLIEWMVLGWFVHSAPTFVAMVADLGLEHVPRVFSLVTSGAYAVTCLAGLVAAALFADRLPRGAKARVVGLASVAAVGAGLVALTWCGLYAPIFEISANIR